MGVAERQWLHQYFNKKGHFYSLPELVLVIKLGRSKSSCQNDSIFCKNKHSLETLPAMLVCKMVIFATRSLPIQLFATHIRGK